MQPRKNIVYSEVGKNYGHKTDDGKEGCTLALPFAGEAGVEKDGVNEPGDQGPGLFGVPTPVRSPGIAGPSRARNDTDGQERKAHSDHFVNQRIQRFQRGEQGQPSPFLLAPLFFPILDQVQHAHPTRKSKRGVTEKAGNHVGMEPVALQGRNQGVDFGRDTRGERSIADKEKGKGQRKAPSTREFNFRSQSR